MEPLFKILDHLKRTVTTTYLDAFPDVEEWEGKTSTLILTDECNLRCTYCYCAKTPNAMTWDTAKTYIDLLFNAALPFSDIPLEQQIPIEHKKLFEFIGGEPLLESELMFKCIDYILKRVDELPNTHPWKREWMCTECDKGHPGIRFMISTNGLLLNDKKIQEMFYRIPQEYFHIGVTLDGTRQMHDLCRVTPNGEGSYDDVIRAWRWLKTNYPAMVVTTKSTLSTENLDYLYDIVRYCYDIGLVFLAQNCVFENVWKRGDQLRLFRQLVKAADFMLERDRYKKMGVRWFTPTIFSKSDKTVGKWCGAGTHMDCCDYKGKIYPCLRFKQLHQRDPFVMGTISSPVNRNIFNDTPNPIFDPIQKQISGLKCADCPVSALCSDCQAYAYDCFGSLQAKSPFICPMHKATVVGNIYFFTKLFGNTLEPEFLEPLLLDWTKNDYFSTDGDITRWLSP